ncbi:hypothetical protein [Metabacillus herbersteinensis]
MKHIGEFEQHLVRNSNIREKVKAVHIFRDKVGCSIPRELTKLEEQLFLSWFSYDYKTIQGFTLYQVFLKNIDTKSIPFEAVFHALLMASVLEPFKIIEVNNDYFVALHLMTNEQSIIKSNLDILYKRDDLVFLRCVPIYDYLFSLHPGFQFNDEKRGALLKHFQNTELSWRTFLKKHAIQFAWNGKTDQE